MSFSAYQEYKDGGVEWLGEVPAHWEVTAIKHISSTPVTDGPHETPEFLDKGIPFVSAEAVSSGEINFAKIRGYISQTDHERYCQKYKPEVGDVYMVKSGASTGTTAIVEDDREFSIWSPLAAIRCNAESFPRFVLNFLRSSNFQEGVTLNWSFGTQQNIGMNVIENLQITRPPIDEQRAIARFLDAETLKIDALVAEQRWLIELLTEKRQAVISHAVTKGLNPNAPMKPSGIPWLGDVPKHWEATRLKYICDIWASNIDKKSVDGQQAVLLCNYTDVYYSDEITDGIEFMKATATEDQIERFALRNGDVIITKDSESADDIGVSTYVPATLPGVVCGYHLSMIRPNSNSDGAFIKLLFDTAYVKAKLATLANGLTRYGLGRSAINDLFVPTPPKPEQQVISNYLASVIDKLAALERKAESAIDLLQERRTALISAAVTGKIDVRQHACQETA